MRNTGIIRHTGSRGVAGVAFLLSAMLLTAPGLLYAQAPVRHTLVHPAKAPAAKTPDPFWVESYTAALEAAQDKGRLVLVCLAPVNCTSCTVATDKTLNRRGVLDSLRKECVAGVYLYPRDPDWKHFQVLETGAIADWDWPIDEQSPIDPSAYDQTPATFVFLSPDGICLERCDSALPKPEAYYSGLADALDRQDDIRKVKILESGRVLGDADEDNLEAIIREEAWAHQPVDSLLDLYIGNLSVDSIASPRVMRFLVLQAPVLNSDANQLLRQDPALFKRVWMGLSMEDRFQVNNRVIEKTWKKAAREHDLAGAQLAATFAANTNVNPEARLRAFQGVMIEYYYGVGDTSQFLNLAGTYYDRFLMRFNADSLRRQDSLLHRGPAVSVSRFLAVQLGKAAERVSKVSASPGMTAMAHTWAARAVALCPTEEERATEAVLRKRMEETGTAKTAGP